MGKSVNVMVEVEERVYDSVVAPHKKDKSFSKLLRTLLTGYADSPVIRGYCDNSFNEARKSRMAALDDIIGSMQESLASMGLYSDELKANTQEGIDSMSGVKSQVDVDTVENPVYKSRTVLGIGMKEDEMSKFMGNITKKTSDLEDRMNEISKQTSMIIELLSSRGVGVSQEVKEAEAKEPVVKKPEPVKEEVFKEEEPLVVIDDDDDIDEPQSSADDILQGLLGGMSYEF